MTAADDGLRQWLTFAARARDRLDGLALVAECDIDAADIEAAAAHLGRYLNNHSVGDGKRVLRRTSVGLALLLPKVGELHYQDDTFWANFWDLAGVTASRRGGLEPTTGEEFRQGLFDQRLQVLEDVGRINVDNILFHAGIPHALLDKWFSLLQDGLKAVGPDSEDVLAWAIRSAETEKPDMAKPIARLLLHGGGFAADLVERSLSLLRASAQGGQPTADETGLPPAFINAAKGSLQGNRERSAPGGRQTPAIRLRAEDGTVVLVLPPVPGFQGPLAWTVAMDGETVHAPAPRVWGGAGGWGSATVQIDAPVRTVGISAPGLEETASIELFDESLPVMAFDGSGRRLRPSAGLPKESVWLLHLHSESGLEVEGGRAVLDIGAPLGWTGWSLQLWDLTGASSLSYGSTRLRLRGQARARIVSDDDRVLEWARVDGFPIRTARPRVVLPAGSARRWTVQLHDHATDQVVTSFAVDPGGSEVDPLRDLPAPAVGIFTIRVLGLGSDTSRTVAIAEGLRAVCEPIFRVFDSKGGLAPCTVKLRLDGADEPQQELHLQRADESTAVRLSANGRTLDAIVTPPSLATSVQRPGRIPERWSHGPATVFREELDGTRLLLRIDRGADPDLQLCKGETVLHTIPATTVTAGRNVLYDLAKAKDTVLQGNADRLLLGRTQGDPGVLVAVLRPARLASGVTLEGRQARLTDPAPAELEAVVWCTGRPWDPPVVRPVAADGTVVQEPGEHFTGRAVVLPRVFDDWAEPEPPPRFPRKRSVLISDLDGTAASGLEWFARPDPLWRQLLQAESEERLWAAFLLDSVLVPRGVRMPEDRAKQLSTRLSRNGRLAARALVPFALPVPEAAAALLRTLVAAMPMTGPEPPTDEWIAAAFGRDPVSAALLAMPWITRNPDSFPAGMEAARSALGTSAIGFIVSGTDVDRGHGSTLTAVVQPSGSGRLTLLSAAAREAAAAETLSRSPKALLHTATACAKEVLAGLVAQHYDAAAEAVRQRGLLVSESDLPAASLAWAIACRFAARSKRFQEIVKKHVAWRQNAHAIAPQLAGDLVIAEIYASHAFPLKETS